MVRRAVGRTFARANDGLEGILALLARMDGQFHLSTIRQWYWLLGSKRPIGIDSFDSHSHDHSSANSGHLAEVIVTKFDRTLSSQFLRRRLFFHFLRFWVQDEALESEFAELPDDP